MEKQTEQYRTDHDSVFELNDDETAYLFIGKLNGRTLGEFLADRRELDLTFGDVDG